MTTKIGASVFVDPSEIRRDRTASGGGCLIFGPYPTVERLDLYFDATDAIDVVIAELTALRAEMTGDTDDTYRLTPKGDAVLDGPGCDCMADAPAQDETPSAVAS